MNYARRNNTSPFFQSSRTKTGISLSMKILAGLLVLIAVLYVFLPRALPSIFLSFVQPLWKAESDARLGTATIEELRKTYENMSVNGNINNSLLRENEELKALLGRTDSPRHLLAVVL